MSPPLVSAIVLAYNGREDLPRSLEALLASAHPAMEVIVVDNASSDESAEVAARYPVRLVRNAQNLGFAGGCNTGLEHASGKYVALVNQDAVVDPAWAADLVSFLEATPQSAAAGGKRYAWDGGATPERKGDFHGYARFSGRWGTPAERNPPDVVREVATLSGCAAMIRRAAIEDVGPPFLEPLFFLYYEETDFFARALRRGWKLHYVPDAVVWHRTPLDDARPYYFHYYMTRNRVLFAYRNLDDEPLREIVRYTRKKAWAARVKARLGRLLDGHPEKQRAIRDAWRWIRQNRELLLDHRAREAPSGFCALVESIQGGDRYRAAAR